jgi:hypothetical protein
MKRIVINIRSLTALALALVLAASLASCGFNLGQYGQHIKYDDLPLRRDDGTDVVVSVSGGKSLNMPDPSGIDFSSIMNGLGGAGTVWGEQTEEIKQQLIKAARENGFEISFDENGCAVLTGVDGTQMKQNADGSWLPVEGSGNVDIPQLGGDWPDNEFTRLVPNPGFKILMANGEEEGFTAAFTEVTVAQVRAYAEKLRAAGFTEDEELQDEEVMGMVIYSFFASNGKGYSVSLSYASEMASLVVSKE